MAGAGKVELLIKLVGDARFDAQQHAVGEGGVGFGEQPVEQRFAASAQGVDPMQQPIAIIAGEYFDTRTLQQTVDAFARQVSPVIELIEDGRFHQLSADLHTMTVVVARQRACADLHLPRDRARFPVVDEAFHFKLQALTAFFDRGVADHRANEGEGGRVFGILSGVVEGEIRFSPTGREGKAGVAQDPGDGGQPPRPTGLTR